MHVEANTILRIFAWIFDNLNNAGIELLPDKKALNDEIIKSDSEKLVIANELSFLKVVVYDNHRSHKIDKILYVVFESSQGDLSRVNDIHELMVWIGGEYLN